jgi:hypothetical protein
MFSAENMGLEELKQKNVFSGKHGFGKTRD